LFDYILFREQGAISTAARKTAKLQIHRHESYNRVAAVMRNPAEIQNEGVEFFTELIEA
jgi:hypothetical protein